MTNGKAPTRATISSIRAARRPRQSGTLSSDSRWPEGDFRNIYFTPANLAETLSRVERLKEAVPPGMDLPEMALRFILASPGVSTVNPGMRKPRHVERNIAISDGNPLDLKLLQKLRGERWVRTTTIE